MRLLAGRAGGGLGRSGQLPGLGPSEGKGGYEGRLVVSTSSVVPCGAESLPGIVGPTAADPEKTSSQAVLPKGV